MPTLDQIIDNTKLLQDIELATAISELKSNPKQLNLFLQNQQDLVFNDIVKQKDNTFQKVYGDLKRATIAQDSIAMYNKRSKELEAINNQVYKNQENIASTITEDKNLAGRKNEMNEWTVNNKKDTLFVFSSIFIMLSGLLLIVVLWRLSVINSYICTALGAPLIIICILIILNRSQYTNVLRNKRYWNKKIFEGKYNKIPIPNICPDTSPVASGLPPVTISAALPK
jgi:hypothetical protein